MTKLQMTGIEQKTFSGFSLLYTLLLLTLLTMLLTSFITLFFISKKQSLELITRSAAERDVYSAMTLLRDPSFELHSDEPVTISLYDGTDDSVICYRNHWGFFGLIRASVERKNYRFSAVALYGDYCHSEDLPALLLGNCYKPLCICGNTILKGNFKVAKAGIKASSISGRYYEGPNNLVDGTVETDDHKMPAIKPYYLLLQPKYQINSPQRYSQIIKYGLSSFSDTLINSFHNKTIILCAENGVVLDGCFLQGNVMVLSDSSILLKKSALINDIIICAKKIMFEPGFKGTGQFIASDSLRCGPWCTFPYPSSLAVIHTGSGPAPFLLLDKMCRLDGSVICYSDKSPKPHTAILQINKDCMITGSVYSNQLISLSGKVFGNIMIPGFLLKTPISIYENFLLDVVIDYTRQPQYYCGIRYNENESILKIIKWLQ
jgi:hypothetical protein